MWKVDPVDSRRVKVIAEAGVNHNGRRELAFQLIDAACEAGADYVKFQTFSADRIVQRSAPKARYQEVTTPTGETQYEMLRGLEISQEDHVALLEYSRSVGIGFLSTPFDRESLAFLVSKLGLDVIKLPSSDLTNLPLVVDAGRSGASIIMSTGMASLGEIELALNVVAFAMTESGQPPRLLSELDGLRSAPDVAALVANRVTLLHCTSEYPSLPGDANLRSMDTMRMAFGLSVGYSDHSQGIAVPLAAVALGASVIEKHLTLDRTMAGPDHAASCEPPEFTTLVNGIREVEAAIGDGRKIPTESEFRNRHAMRKGLVAARDIAAGRMIVDQDVAVLRPVSGDGAERYWDWVGTEAPGAFSAGDSLHR